MINKDKQTVPMIEFSNFLQLGSQSSLLKVLPLLFISNNFQSVIALTELKERLPRLSKSIIIY